MRDKDDNAGRVGHKQELVGSWKRRGLKAEVDVPVTLEHVLLEAARDEDFRRNFLDDPTGAVEKAGLRLTDSESAMLGSLPREALMAMIDRMAPERQKNRRFLRAVTAATVAGGMLVTGCDLYKDGADDGVGPDIDSDTYEDTDDDAGPDGG